MKLNTKEKIIKRGWEFNHVEQKSLIIKLPIIWPKMKRTFPENERFVSGILLVWKKKSNMTESTSGDPRGQDTEEVLIYFSEEELDYV